MEIFSHRASYINLVLVSSLLLVGQRLRWLPFFLFGVLDFRCIRSNEWSRMILLSAWVFALSTVPMFSIIEELWCVIFGITLCSGYTEEKVFSWNGRSSLDYWRSRYEAVSIAEGMSSAAKTHWSLGSSSWNWLKKCFTIKRTQRANIVPAIILDTVQLQPPVNMCSNSLKHNNWNSIYVSTWWWKISKFDDTQQTRAHFES